MTAILVQLDDGETRPLASCEWVFFKPCGCPVGCTWPVYGDTVLATEADAFHDMYGSKAQAAKARKGGITARLVSGEEFREIIAPALGERCGHAAAANGGAA